MSPASLALDPILEPLLHSPCLVEYVEQLQARVADEMARREQFYEEMTDAEKVEFIEGEVVVHSPARAAHLMVSGSIQVLLSTHVAMHRLGRAFFEKCLCVFPRNDYEPDVVFFGRQKSELIEPDTMKFPVPDFIVEVLSESTEHRDRGLKFRDYEAHGVSEYWIVDADAQIVEQYVLKNGRFELALKSGSGEISSLTVSGFRVPIAAFFNPETHLATLQTLLASVVTHTDGEF